MLAQEFNKLRLANAKEFRATLQAIVVSLQLIQ
jgi:hypothetical protein